jgi:hypothetical protein
MTLFFKLPTLEDDITEDEFISMVLDIAKTRLSQVKIDRNADTIEEDIKDLLQVFQDDLKECEDEFSKLEFKKCVHLSYIKFKNSLSEFEDELSYDGQERKESSSEFDTSSVSSLASLLTVQIILIILLNFII